MYSINMKTTYVLRHASLYCLQMNAEMINKIDLTLVTELDWQLFQLQRKYLDYQVNIGNRIIAVLQSGEPDAAFKAQKLSEPKKMFQDMVDNLFKDWDDSMYALKEYVSDPPSDELIASVEEELGYKLPAAYIWLMKQHNGGIPVNTCYPCDEPTCWAEDHVAITGIFGIGREKSITKTQVIEFDEAYFKGKDIYVFDDVVTTTLTVLSSLSTSTCMMVSALLLSSVPM